MHSGFATDENTAQRHRGVTTVHKCPQRWEREAHTERSTAY